MPDYPPGYDPIQANYGGGSYVSAGDQAIGGLIGLAAFAGIGVGAFFTYSAAAAGPIVLSGVTYTYGTTVGTVVYSSAGTGLTAGQISGLAAARALALSGVAPVTLEAMMTAFGFIRVGSVASLLALAAFNSDSAYGSGFIGPGLGGYYGVPHNFPGTGFLPGGPPGSYWACVILDGDVMCQLYF